MSKKRQEPAQAERLAEMSGPAAIGHVLWFDAEHGSYRRRPVRVPLDILEEVAAGPASPPDHRSTHVVWIERELMSDATLHELHRKENV